MSVERHSVADILRATPHTLSVQWYQGDDPVDPGTVTVTITNSDGNAVATDAATGGSGTNPRTYSLTPAQTAQLTTLTAVWTSAGDGSLAANTEVTTYAEVVGDLLFTLAEARTFDGGALSDTAKYSDATLIELRAMIADAFALRCGVPFGRRYTRQVLDGSGTSRLMLPHIHIGDVRSIETRNRGEQTWTAFTADELADVLVDSWGRIERESLGTFPAGRRNVRVGYEHGIERVPLEISRAALLVLRDVAVKSNVDDRATSFTDEFGARTFVVQAGVRGALYSIPEVNAILQEHTDRIPGVA